ncbi:MAG: hypothetical protein M3Q22_14185 [Actinomycetota bacterium]|nr:hypothetical protein [Actinomycetota bacterium]
MARFAAATSRRAQQRPAAGITGHRPMRAAHQDLLARRTTGKLVLDPSR